MQMTIKLLNPKDYKHINAKSDMVLKYVFADFCFISLFFLSVSANG